MTTATAELDAVHHPTRERTSLLDTAVMLMATASTLVIVGLIWDISWHRTIGRDTFWTPAHMAIYLGGLISGLVSSVLVFRATFGTDAQLRAASVRFWGFRAPIGAWIAIWGTIAMLTSAPFDNWWHNAYGLDVKVLSPPHVVLGLGMMSIQIGALLLAASRKHAGAAVQEGWRVWVPIWIAGVWLAMFMEMIFEYRIANGQHTPSFYVATALAAPLVLAAAARGLAGRWPATAAAACYMAVNLALLWILPRFAATPRLGPIYNPITHMTAPAYPLLLIVPAAAFDLLIHRWDGRAATMRALIAGGVFVALLLVVQWPFADFLVHSPAARSPLFASDQWNYNNRLGPWQYQFWSEPRTASGALDLPVLGRGLLAAMLAAAVTTRIGIAFGSWIDRVRW